MNEFVEPLGMRVLIRKDENRQITRGGIVLPDKAEIPTISGRVVEVSLQFELDADVPIAKYDKVLFHPKNAIAVDLEGNNLLFMVFVEDVVAVLRRSQSPGRQRAPKQPTRASTREAGWVGEESPADSLRRELRVHDGPRPGRSSARSLLQRPRLQVRTDKGTSASISPAGRSRAVGFRSFLRPSR